MKKCPYCAEEIQDEAIVCRYCGRELTTKATIAAVASAVETTSAKPAEKKPFIGGVGCLAIVIGFFFLMASGTNNGFGWLLLLGGMGILAYALVTGNIKLFG